MQPLECVYPPRLVHPLCSHPGWWSCISHLCCSGRIPVIHTTPGVWNMENWGHAWGLLIQVLPQYGEVHRRRKQEDILLYKAIHHHGLWGFFLLVPKFPNQKPSFMWPGGVQSLHIHPTQRPEFSELPGAALFPLSLRVWRTSTPTFPISSTEAS